MRIACAAVWLLLVQTLPATAVELLGRGSFVWTGSFDGFGGFSAIWVGDGGTDFITISDRGIYVSGRLTRTDGAISGVTVSTHKDLPVVPVPGATRTLEDAEGIAVAPDGGIYVSYENTHRIWRFASLETAPQATHPAGYFDHLQKNSALEALAVDRNGTLYAIPERSGTWTRPFPVFRGRNGNWDSDLSIPRSDRFLVVGADFGPDGRLYVLERDFALLTGFRSRIRRFDYDGDRFFNEETILQTTLSLLGNAEGISLWRNARGATMLTLIADDNFQSFQSTVISEYEIVEDDGH